jgi:hypothetical protein
MSILIPATSADAWQPLLASGHHWRTGYSARSLAHCWHDTTGLPPEVASAFESTPAFAGAELLLAIPEHKVPLPGVGRASQTDLWLLMRTRDALVSVAVEGKVSESFDKTIGDWLEDATDGGANRRQRLGALCELLGIVEPTADLRYQLFHRAASAILEARRFHAAHAVLLVHSFSQEDAWYDDFARFAEALGAKAVKGRLAQVQGRSGPTLHLGWVRGEAKFLRA